MKTTKHYVIRKGKKIWIFSSRDQVQPLVSGFPDAKYKSFPSQSQAQHAFDLGREPYYQTQPQKNLRKIRDQLTEIPFIQESIAVDAACSGNPGKLEYRGIDLQNGQTLFHQHFEIWTNNIGEFLAIVHALAHFHPAPQTIYSDSKIAINRIHQKICKSKFKTTHTSRQVRQAVEKAEHRLQTHKLSATLLKRNTKERGEIPADFNRK